MQSKHATQRILLFFGGLAAALAPHARATAQRSAPAPSSSPTTTAREPSFRRLELSREFTSEGACIGDFNRDGELDVQSGPWWYAGPEFELRYEIYTPQVFDPAVYSDHFQSWAHDFDRDGWLDVLVVGFPGKQACWFRNPQGLERGWERSIVLDECSNESPEFADVDADGKPELVCMNGGRFGWATPIAGDPRAPWRFHPLSPKLADGPFVHGLGVGDVNGDRRVDVLERTGWWEQPSSLAGDPIWTKHEVAFGQQGGAQMYALDVDEDGDNDVVTSLNAHGFGLAWFEQRSPRDGGIEREFAPHMILPLAQDELGARDAAGLPIRFAELHALALADMDQDGKLDIVTGKRWWSHGAKGDPEPGSAAVVYWFGRRLDARGVIARDASGAVEWIGHRIDDAAGTGVQLAVGDLDGRGTDDIVCAGKRGVHVFIQRAAGAPTGPGAAAEPPPDPLQPRPLFPAARDEQPSGHFPRGIERELNLGFELGLADWSAEGAAFDEQPVYGDLPAQRGRESARPIGKQWIGGYEKFGDGAIGKLTSKPFEIDARWASYRVGGGATRATRVELLDVNGRVFHAASGSGSETMHAVVVDLGARVGQRIRVRLVDEASGAWGHVNFDDFRLSDDEPAVSRAPGDPEPVAWIVDGARPSCNLDFETGTLEGWTATGRAFDDQPVRGDAPLARKRESSRHEGTWWIGGYEKHGDEPTGTLTSSSFAIEARWASFLVGGGASDATRVELWLEDDTLPFFKTSAANYESLQRVVVDLGERVGKRMHIRLVDEATGGWGHIDFDDFLFHAQRPAYARDADVPEILPRDTVDHAGLAPKDAAGAMTLPAGLRVDLVAAEPDLHQPVALAVDGNGRLWVAEAFTYPQRADEGAGRDDIVVFEDRDRDGSYETRTVFLEKLNLVSGLEVGHGGVWIGAAPTLCFVPDRDDDLVPDGPAEIRLDGFGWQDTHETLNSFTWGPDGWLYGCHGVFTDSRVGKPGTPAAERVSIDAGVWRYHPLRSEFEVFAWGTSNPWGIDFDAHGQAFITACVIPHLFHVIQGARYIRQAGSHFDAHAFAEIDTIADHRHWLGASPHGGNLHSNAVGGGHAHCGALIYQGDGLPEAWRERLFVNNIHGNRTNSELLERKDSGFVGRHGEDLLLANDTWFRGIALRQGPTGSVFLIDWYDAQACHATQPERWDRSNGRLYRVQGSADASTRLAAARASTLPADLVGAARVEACLANDTWVRTRARLAIETRGAEPDDLAALARALRGDKDPVRRLRALWALHALTPNDAEPLVIARNDADDSLRAWAIQLECERAPTSLPSAETLEAFRHMARKDTSPRVRLYLASALQRLPLEARWPIATLLALHDEDAHDANIPAVLWYGIEPLVVADPARALSAFGTSPIDSIARWTVRCASDTSAGRDAVCDQLLEQWRRGDHEQAASWLAELQTALVGRTKIALPGAWPALRDALSAQADARTRDAATALSVVFGDAGAAKQLLAIALDREQPLALRGAALDSALELPGEPPTDALLALLDDAALRTGALRGLARSREPAVADALLARWSAFDAEQRRSALSVLSSRPSSARLLLGAVADGRVERHDVTAFALRQLQELGDPGVDALIAAHIGSVRSTSTEKKQRIAELVRTLAPRIADADRAKGRSVFARTCQQCHTLFGSGGTLAPDLSGANRKDLEYLLSNMVDPSAVVGQDYQASVLELADGRMLTGIVKQSTSDTLTLQNESQTLHIARDEVVQQRASGVSTMPDGLLDALQLDDVRDLLGYLQGDAQAPLAMSAATAAQLFDGQSLAHWSGDASVWRVEDGMIVGQTEGLAHNAFLVSDWQLSDFRLELDVLLVDDRGNSGIQFRTQPLAGGEVRGYQADIGPGWWGKLYEENGRGLLVDTPLPVSFKPGDWNHYRIEAVGARVRTWLNDVPCVDIEDPNGPQSGVIALQVHSGEATEVRFRAPRLEIVER